jgi:raffinose/stachyose/melibiose transport system permease protein
MVKTNKRLQKMGARYRDKLGVKGMIAWAIALLIALLWVAITFTPFLFMVMNSFKGSFEMLRSGVFKLPEALDFSNYGTVLSKGFTGYFFRSVIVTSVSLLLMVAISAFASYPLSRMRFKLRGFLYGFIIACMSVPMHVTLIPVFKMTIDMGLYDKIWALPGPYVAFALPMSVFILTNFMNGIPREIEQAAEIDGCGKFGIFFRIIMPLSKAGISTLCIYNGINFWNEYAFVKTLTQSIKSQTLPMAMGNFKGEHSMNIPMVLTVLVLSVLPMIILFCFLQEKLVKGMTAGAVKG